jgi:hypothetical protein
LAIPQRQYRKKRLIFQQALGIPQWAVWRHVHHVHKGGASTGIVATATRKHLIAKNAQRNAHTHPARLVVVADALSDVLRVFPAVNCTK